MIVDDRNPPVWMSVDPAAGSGLAFKKKPVSAQGADEFAYRRVAEEMDDSSVVSHTVTATTGAARVSTFFDAGIS